MVSIAEFIKKIMEQLDIDWQKYYKELKLKNKIQRNINTTDISKFCVKHSVNCHKFTDYHFRLTREPFLPVDVFPTSGKVHVITDWKTRFMTVNIIEFLTIHFGINDR